MDVLNTRVQFEETIKGSRFLSELIPCSSQSQARDLIKEQKQKYADSTHVVHAFITGQAAEVLGMSDDGEPSGTAGRPALDVLKGRGCTNTLLTITRWFGGTLLGTGGLVKAYSNGAREVIAKADSLNAFEPFIRKSDFSFTCDYALHKTVKKSMENFNLYDVKEEFTEGVKIYGKIAAEEAQNFSKLLKEISNGKIDLA